MPKKLEKILKINLGLEKRTRGSKMESRCKGGSQGGNIGVGVLSYFSSRSVKVIELNYFELYEIM